MGSAIVHYVIASFNFFFNIIFSGVFYQYPVLFLEEQYDFTLYLNCNIIYCIIVLSSVPNIISTLFFYLELDPFYT